MKIERLARNEPRLVAAEDEFFVERRAEHVEREARMDAVLVIDDDHGVVVDVGAPATFFEVDEVDRLARGRENPCRLRAGEQVEQIEVVTAFFDQRAAAELAELVPLPDLVQESGAVFAHGDRLDVAKSAAL